MKNNYYLRIGLVAFLALHFGLISISMLPQTWALRAKMEPILGYYICSPFNHQNWRMFAPPPVMSSAVIVRLETPVDTGTMVSEWVDITSGLVKQKYRLPVVNTAYASIGYFFYNCSTELYAIAGAIGDEIVADSISYPNCDEEFGDLLREKLQAQVIKGDRGVANYIDYLLGRDGIHFNVPLDRVNSRLRYRYVCKKFPDFERRHEDYYDLANYEITYMERGPLSLPARP